MIARGMEIIDIEPAGYLNFLDLVPRISPSSPRAVLWHEEGMSMRLVVNGRRTEFGSQTVTDARESAARLYSRYSRQVRQVVVTDRDGYRRYCNAMNLSPRPGELKYDFQHRLNQALAALNGESFAIYPEPDLDRGPVAFGQLTEFFGSPAAETGNVLLGVFDNGQPYFSFVANLASGITRRVTSFEHWPGIIPVLEFSSDGLDKVVQQVEQTDGQVLCALFIARSDLERLFDGQRHDTLPGSLIVSSRAFGISNLPGVAERAFLACAGLFAYVPLFVP